MSAIRNVCWVSVWTEVIPPFFNAFFRCWPKANCDLLLERRLARTVAPRAIHFR
jgi:hypothetical protein